MSHPGPIYRFNRWLSVRLRATLKCRRCVRCGAPATSFCGHVMLGPVQVTSGWCERHRADSPGWKYGFRLGRMGCGGWWWPWYGLQLEKWFPLAVLCVAAVLLALPAHASTLTFSIRPGSALQAKSWNVPAGESTYVWRCGDAPIATGIAADGAVVYGKRKGTNEVFRQIGLVNLGFEAVESVPLRLTYAYPDTYLVYTYQLRHVDGKVVRAVCPSVTVEMRPDNPAGTR